MYQYLTMAGTRLNEATIGIENATGTVGLEVAYNKNYVHDDMGIMVPPGLDRLKQFRGNCRARRSGHVRPDVLR